MERTIQHGLQRLNDCLGRHVVQGQRSRRHGGHDASPLAARPSESVPKYVFVLHSLTNPLTRICTPVEEKPSLAVAMVVLKSFADSPCGSAMPASHNSPKSLNLFRNRLPHQRVGGPEQSQGGDANSGREMGDAGIVTHEELAPRQDCRQFRQRHISQHLPRRAESAEQRADAALFLDRPANQDAGHSFLGCPRQHLLPAFQGPQLMPSTAAGMHRQHTALQQSRRLPESISGLPALCTGKHAGLSRWDLARQSQKRLQKVIGHVYPGARMRRPSNDLAGAVPLEVVCARPCQVSACRTGSGRIRSGKPPVAVAPGVHGRTAGRFPTASAAAMASA